MKEPIFNDLSIYPLCVSNEEMDERVSSFMDVLEFCGFLGFRKVRMDRSVGKLELMHGYFLKDYLFQNAKGNQNGVQLILNMLKPPYIDEGTVSEERYMTHTARFKKGDQNIEAEGLSCAFFSESFAVGFASEAFWKNDCSFKLSVTVDETKKKCERRIFCISCVGHFKKEDFIQWAVGNLDLQFRPSEKSIESKRVNIRHDHGEDKLNQFASVIKKEPYIIEVVNSLPFEHNCRKMTRLRGKDGLIDIRMLNTKEKIGIVVRTTARNEMEALYLAADIERKYA